MLKTFDIALSQLGPFEPNPTIAVALSGGSDSMALTLLTLDWVKQQGGTLITLTVDHSLREESRAEAEQVAEWMHARGIAHYILTPRHTPAGNNLMQAARSWRYHALSEWCREQGVLHCLLAHHRDDQLETAMMQTKRGDTEDGGAGMSAIRLYRGVRFLRPLLEESKQTLVSFLKEQDVAWVEDPTNRQPQYARTQAREALEYTDSTNLLAGMHAQRAERKARELALAEAAVQLVILHPSGYATLKREGWLALETNLRQQLLADLITTIGSHIHRPRRHETTWLDQSMHAKSGSQTLGQCIISWKGATATIAREPARVEPPVTLQGKGTLLWDQRFRVHYDVAAPLTLGALGERGRKIAGCDLPPATPALWHLDVLRAIPHMEGASLPESARLQIGFAPAKPLAARAFW